ncbi:MAG: hypothetical protein HFJ54_06725 [Clostridia bacterium]|nr:hypothetical protein [Clostridia bacterium]
MDRNAKIIYNKLENVEVGKKGYIDLSKVKIQGKEDLIETCNIFRDSRYETFRIFYMKDNMIVGQEAITSKIPDAVMLFSKDKYSEFNPIRTYETMKNRMNRLKADGYYLAHNHTSDSAKPSQNDMETTRNFVANVDGFLGHIILGNKDKYSIIEENSKGLILMPKEKVLSNNTIKSVKEKLSDNSLYNIKISNREELVALIKQIQNEKEYSVAILTDCKCNIRMVLDIPNRMFNQNIENLNGFFKNLARNSGSTRVFIGTQDTLTYNQILKHQKYGTIKDTVYFNNDNNLYRLEKMTKNPDLFDKEKLQKNKTKDKER